VLFLVYRQKKKRANDSSSNANDNVKTTRDSTPRMNF
jgi:hypothetical protein